MTERGIHEAFIAWLRKLEIPYVYHRADKKSGIQSGWPDFTVLWCSHCVCIEVKTEKGRLSKDQKRVIAFIRKSGNRVEICRSCEQCVEAVKNILCENLQGFEFDNPLAEVPRFREEFRELKRAVAAVPTTLPQQPLADRNGEGQKSATFYIGDWNRVPYVFAPDLDGSYKLIRKASTIDIANLPKLTDDPEYYP